MKGWAPMIRLHRDRIVAMWRGDALDRALLSGHPTGDDSAAADLARAIELSAAALAAFRADLVAVLNDIDELTNDQAVRVESYRLAARTLRATTRSPVSSTRSGPILLKIDRITGEESRRRR